MISFTTGSSSDIITASTAEVYTQLKEENTRIDKTDIRHTQEKKDSHSFYLLCSNLLFY